MISRNPLRRMLFGILAVAIGYGICLSACMLRPKQQTFWIVPKGEHVWSLRTGRTPGEILVLSEAKGRWLLRSLTEAGHAQLLAKGEGLLQGMTPLSPLSRSGDKVLIGIAGKPTRVPGFAAECSLSKGTTRPVAAGVRSFVFWDRQPFAPIGDAMVLFGSSSEWKHKDARLSGVWLCSSGVSEPKLLYKTRHLVDIGWLPDGRVFIFDMPEGTLRVGSPTNLQVYGTFTDGSMAAPSPDGKHLLVAAGKEKVVLYRMDLSTGKRTLLCKSRSWAKPWGIEWSRDGDLGVLILDGEGVHSVLIRQDWTVQDITQMPERWNPQAGVAFLSSDRVAVVEYTGGNPSERISAVPVR